MIFFFFFFEKNESISEQVLEKRFILRLLWLETMANARQCAAPVFLVVVMFFTISILY